MINFFQGQEANKKQREQNERKCEVYQEVLFDLCHYLLIVSTIFPISISDQEPGKIEENEEEAVANDCKERRFENARMICFPLQRFCYSVFQLLNMSLVKGNHFGDCGMTINSL